MTPLLTLLALASIAAPACWLWVALVDEWEASRPRRLDVFAGRRPASFVAPASPTRCGRQAGKDTRQRPSRPWTGVLAVGVCWIVGAVVGG